jgi:hypothetical protein
MLINCPDCQTEISDRARECRHCGFPVRNLCPRCRTDLSLVRTILCTECGIFFPKEGMEKKVALLLFALIVLLMYAMVYPVFQVAFFAGLGLAGIFFIYYYTWSMVLRIRYAKR